MIIPTYADIILSNLSGGKALRSRYFPRQIPFGWSAVEITCSWMDVFEWMIDNTISEWTLFNIRQRSFVGIRDDKEVMLFKLRFG
jgi:hypothetical protein